MIYAYHSNFILYKKMDVNNIDIVGVLGSLNEHEYYEFSFTKLPRFFKVSFPEPARHF